MIRNFVWGFKFQPRDLWVGLFWDREDIASGGGIFGTTWRFYFCILPMLPLVFRFDTGGLTERTSTQPSFVVKKMVGVIPHDCEGGAGCAFPDLEHIKPQDGLCEPMRMAVLPVSHRVQRNEGRKTCVACREAL